MKYCVNCVHYSSYKLNGIDQHVCYRIKHISPVTGQITSVELLCEIERDDQNIDKNACGSEARYYKGF